MRPRDLLERAFLVRLGALAAALAGLGALVVLAGVVPIRASSGHWAVTRWFLELSKQRSVETHSLAVEVPALDDPALVLKGAAHYEGGCKPCHGAPDEPRSRIVSASTPAPPRLSEAALRWDAAELFYIVKHGIKLTAMPPWPAQERDDEIWAVVAFLQRLPSLDEAEYRRLARGEAAGGDEDAGLARLGDPPAPAVESCARCHGADGAGRGRGAFPRIGGQNVAYLAATLDAYAAGRRRSGIMEPVAAALDESVRLELARYYGRRGGATVLSGGPAVAAPGAPGGGFAEDAPETRRRGSEAPLPRLTATPEALALGERIARAGLPERKVPSCVDCHGPADHPHDPYYPVLAGQYPDYLALQLRLFQEDRRGGSAYHPIMREVARHLTPEQRDAVAVWYGSLGGAPASP